MSVTKLPVRRVPITEAQILRNRYDEARAIKDAWDTRHRRAQREHSDAIRHRGDIQATRRNLDAIEIQVQDAAGELKVALNAWMAATLPNHDRRAS
ncbi:hypothetical protein ACFFGR_09430 [Arthrobacter liuii]|uniref:Uncharacterized protein n=1 Tax=Arthrobacter liuii TaxID=1476996 RepID=A0ABQ2AQL9_9MICC|nr:hypothetical protein [Arthrobacter liuii]GGH93901.1 hypothetical protein GCM10007170_15850 [Arthrobacter liuii]